MLFAQVRIIIVAAFASIMQSVLEECANHLPSFDHAAELTMAKAELVRERHQEDSY